jgi:hypothetical protein
VDVNVPREVKAHLNRGGDRCHNTERGHRAISASFAERERVLQARHKMRPHSGRDNIVAARVVTHPRAVPGASPPVTRRSHHQQSPTMLTKQSTNPD